MESLPKIARERLGSTSASPHPDADLLTAFAEQSLSQREQSQVADHISRCSDCRQVLILASPEQRSPLSPAWKPGTRADRFSQVFAWPVLRWGVIAACVVVLSAVGLRLGRRTAPQLPANTASTAQVEKPDFAMKEREAVAPAGDTDASQADTRKRSVELYAKKSLPAPSKVPPTAENRKQFLQLPEERASGNAAAILALAPPVESKEADKLARVPAAAAPLRAAADQTSPVPAAGSLSQQLAKDSTLADGKTTDSPHANSARADLQSSRQVSSEVVGVTAHDEAVQAESAPVARNAPPKSKAERDEPREKVRFAGARPSNEVAATAAATSGGLLMHDVSSAKWTLSPEGLPQRSFDAGKTWEKMQVDHHTGFRALSAQGLNVWVGGLAGVLYHSSDVGMHWTRIVPTSDDNILASDILSLDFRDPLHGKLTTANQESWLTSDGGKSWQKQ